MSAGRENNGSESCMWILLRGGADPERAQRADHLPRGVKAQKGSIFLRGAFRSMRVGRFCARGTGQVTCSGGGRNCAMRLLLTPRLLCSSPSPLFIFSGTGEFRGSSAFSSGTPGPSSRGRAAGRGRRPLREHPGNGRGGKGS